MFCFLIFKYPHCQTAVPLSIVSADKTYPLWSSGPVIIKYEVQAAFNHSVTLKA